MPQMADIIVAVDNQRANFNTGPYGKPPLKIKTLKIQLHHVLSSFMTLALFMASEIGNRQTQKIHVL